MQVGQEDCLYIHVYTTSSPDSAGDKLPVMVWIHGGGLVSGDGYLNGMYDGAALARTFGVVVVTVQYRLGTFGYLGLPEFAVAGRGMGNMGLMDQQQGIKWARSNAAAFGGDRKRVMVFGESAGANSMYAHLASPTSAGLFETMVVESGNPSDPQTRTAAATEAFSRSFADTRGCHGAGSALVACLRALSTDVLLYPKGADYDKGCDTGVDCCACRNT